MGAEWLRGLRWPFYSQLGRQVCPVQPLQWWVRLGLPLELSFQASASPYSARPRPLCCERPWTIATTIMKIMKMQSRALKQRSLKACKMTNHLKN
uniref:Uncharacterized protein n=1 Tax=Anguilla anguilla TaxID=7936 RepID=A0A0E9XA16_ANGAN